MRKGSLSSRETLKGPDYSGVGGWNLHFIPGRFSEETNHSKTRQLTLTIMWKKKKKKKRKPCFNLLFIKNNSFAICILKSFIRSVFSINQTVSEKSFPPQMFLFGQNKTLFIYLFIFSGL